MIRDLRFDEIERADRRRRLTRLVIACLLVSTAGSFLVSRELKIRKEYKAIPEAQMGDLASLRSRHDAIEGLLSKHHVWTGAYSVRDELDALVVSIHSEETVIAKQEAEKAASVSRIVEEAEAARLRAYAFVEKREYELAVAQLERAVELTDSLGADADSWEHREKVLGDIAEIRTLLAEGGAR
ncbi:MAG: hypothetical protein AAGG01_06530 [Planctomycetota bacterium]